MALLGQAVPTDRLVVAIDPGKVKSRVWLSTGERGLVCEPVSLPTSRAGLAELDRLVAAGAAGPPLIALEQTGALHGAWQVALEGRWPGALRVFAPSETQAARAQLGSRRMKTDDRGAAAGGDGVLSYAARRRNLACRPRSPLRDGAHESLPPRRRLISLPHHERRPRAPDLPK